MKCLQVLLFSLVLVGGESSAFGSFSLQPATIHAGETAALRIDDDDGCFEFDAHTVKRDGNTVTVEILGSDFVQMPCVPKHVTPILLPLGSFATGTYSVAVFVCGPFPIDPCGEPTLLGLSVGNVRRPATIPAVGWIALLLSCSGILALAFTTRPAGPRR